MSTVLEDVIDRMRTALDMLDASLDDLQRKDRIDFLDSTQIAIQHIQQAQAIVRATLPRPN
jgi:hypothetical protein